MQIGDVRGQKKPSLIEKNDINVFSTSSAPSSSKKFGFSFPFLRSLLFLTLLLIDTGHRLALEQFMSMLTTALVTSFALFYFTICFRSSCTRPIGRKTNNRLRFSEFVWTTQVILSSTIRSTGVHSVLASSTTCK